MLRIEVNPDSKDFSSLIRTYRQRSEVARGNDATITSLKNEITKLRMQHATEHKKLRGNAEEDRKLMVSISAKVNDIIFDVKTTERLNGKCYFESVLNVGG